MTYSVPTAALLADLPTLAAWTGDRLGSRKSLILAAWGREDARCVICTTVTNPNGDKGDRPVVGHFIPASMITPGVQGKARGGYDPRNVALMCDDCNDAIGDSIVTRLAFRPTYLGTFPTTRRGTGREVPASKRAAVAAATA